MPEPIDLPIDGTLDLHTFAPGEVKSVVMAYLQECQSRDIREIRIVHGKGVGNLRRQVHAVLERIPEVEHFALADACGGGWGATVVTLRRG